MKNLHIKIFLIFLFLINASVLGAGSGSGVTLTGVSVHAIGEDLFDAGAGIFTSGTYSWSAYSGNTIANDANTLKITYNNHASGASLYLRDTSDLSSDLTVGQLYKFQLDVKVNAGTSAGVRMDLAIDINITNITNTEFQTYTIYFIAGSATGTLFLMRDMNGTEIIWLDNITLQTFD